MDWPLPHNLNSTIARTLSYSDKFNYPLTPKELYFWQIGTRYPKSKFTNWSHQKLNYSFLPGREKIVSLRIGRLNYSRQKWQKINRLVPFFKSIPFLQAIFITGSLSMNNSPEFDDIDIMVISLPGTVWIVRPLIILFLTLMGIRRDPGIPLHSSPAVSDKICDNIYLDTANLVINYYPGDYSKNLYLSHEILQAKCVFDKGGVHRRFIQSNSWVKKYLPVAYGETLKSLQSIHYPAALRNQVATIILFVINSTFFIFQYLYMRPRITREVIGLGFAFFHPRKAVI